MNHLPTEIVDEIVSFLVEEPEREFYGESIYNRYSALIPYATVSITFQ
jgi:hypothetical protein